MKLKFLFLILCIAICGNSVFAQCKEVKWPEDATQRAQAEKSVAIYGDALKQKNYRAATSSLMWMMTNVPQWNTKLYIEGADIYDNLAEAEKDPAKKQVLADSLLLIYDLRIKNCNDEVNVMNRKAYASYKYNVKNKERVAGLLALYDKVFEISNGNVSDGNLVAYMTTIRANQLAFKNLKDEEILMRYDKVMAIIDAKIAKTPLDKKADIDKLKGYKDAVDGLLIQMVKVDCNFVRTQLAPKFKANPNDLALAKKIVSFMLADKCADDPLWLEAAEVFYRLNPEKDFGLAKTLAARYINDGKFDKAETMMKEAAPLATTPEQKADANMILGSIEAKKGNNAGARTLFLQAGTKEAFEKVGDLYYNSFDDCKKQQSLAQDRLVYLAAYEMYQKAGNAQLMARAKAQFPSKEEIFLLNWTAGSNQRVECWINESVVLKTRD